jgi:hypothetical protein
MTYRATARMTDAALAAAKVSRVRATAAAVTRVSSPMLMMGGDNDEEGGGGDNDNGGVIGHRDNVDNGQDGDGRGGCKGRVAMERQRAEGRCCCTYLQ